MKTSKINYTSMLLLVASCLISRNAFATDWFYIEAGATRSTVDVEATKFNPILPRLKMGIALMQGILLEFQYSGSGDDTVGTTNIEIEEITAAYLRLDTPIRSSMRMYVLIGKAETKLNVRGSAGPSAGTDTYEDFSWGVGIEDRLWSEHTLLTLEYAEYYNQDEVVISGVSFGFKVEF